MRAFKKPPSARLEAIDQVIVVDRVDEIAELDRRVDVGRRLGGKIFQASPVDKREIRAEPKLSRRQTDDESQRDRDNNEHRPAATGRFTCSSFGLLGIFRL